MATPKDIQSKDHGAYINPKTGLTEMKPKTTKVPEKLPIDGTYAFSTYDHRGKINEIIDFLQKLGGKNNETGSTHFCTTCRCIPCHCNDPLFKEKDAD